MNAFHQRLCRLSIGLSLALMLAAALPPLPARAWSDHASLLWPLVRGLPALQENVVTVESLESFVRAEAAGLEALLLEHEHWAREELPHYAPRPSPLAFAANADDPRQAFLEAIRVNPELAYRPYRQVMAGEVPSTATLAWADLSFLSVGTSHLETAYLPLEPDALVAPAHVIASASDEPDFGIDIGLFDDNGTSFGRRYGFGAQPFGNPNLEYSSQAPFHMGFYHLDWLVRRAQPGLLRTYPAWRIALFGELSAFAFRTGHDYWGWRFAGWALHYIGDLTQPYHATPLPGVTTLEALWLVLRGRSGDAVQLVSNRHGVLESYQFQRFRAALATGDDEHPLMAAVAAPMAVPVWSETLVAKKLTRDSVEAAADLDAALLAAVPARYVADPGFEWTGSGEETAIVERVREAGGEDAIAALDAALRLQLERFGRYARAWVNRTLDDATAASDGEVLN